MRPGAGGPTLGCPALLWFRPVFGLGMMEIGLIIALAVMLFPPTELPKLARSIARIYGQVRKTAEDFRSAVLDDEDLREPINEIKGAYNEARFEVRDAERKARQQLAKAQMELRMATARRIQAEKAEQAEQAEQAGPAEPTGESGPGPATESLPAPKPAPEVSTNPSASSADASRSGATPLTPFAEPDEPAVDPRAPVAGVDPRVIAARRSGAYTPRVAVDPDDTASGDEPREGVA